MLSGEDHHYGWTKLGLSASCFPAKVLMREVCRLLNVLTKFTQYTESIEPDGSWLREKFVESDTLTADQ